MKTVELGDETVAETCRALGLAAESEHSRLLIVA